MHKQLRVTKFRRVDTNAEVILVSISKGPNPEIMLESESPPRNLLSREVRKYQIIAPDWAIEFLALAKRKRKKSLSGAQFIELTLASDIRQF